MADYTPEKEWSLVLSSIYLFTRVLDTYGSEIYDEYGSYKNIDPFMRDRILEWLRKERFYRVYLDSEATSALWNGGANLLEAEAMWEQFVKKRKEKDEAEKSPFDYTFDDAGNRVTNLEALFEQFVKQRKGKDGAGSSRAGSSRENN